jgi:TrmH family RNA methyltransferase
VESYDARRLLEGTKIQILAHQNIFFIFAFTDHGNMISSSKSKLIRSLQQKKFRDQHGLFLLEGEKMVRELLTSDPENPFQIKELFSTPEWMERNRSMVLHSGIEAMEASRAEIKKVSNLVTPQAVIALVSIPRISLRAKDLLNTPVLAFESIRDPGNLGTIIRTADWFGISHIVCTPDSTDLYNPKVVQSTMGAITRVRVHYHKLEALLESKELVGKTVFGTFTDGANIYETSLEPDPLILFGNESHGLSETIKSRIRRRITIPSFSPEGKGSESLNLASSVAVVSSELRRRKFPTQSGN